MQKYKQIICNQYAVKYAKHAIGYAEIYANRYAFSKLDNMHAKQYSVLYAEYANQYA